MKTHRLFDWSRLLLAGVLAATIAPASRAVDFDPPAGHPRMFFYAQSLPTLRSRALTGPNQAIYQAFKNYVDGLSGTEVSKMHLFAAMYLLSQDTSYADKAVALAMQATEGDMLGYTHGEGQMFGRISPLVLAYDWCYDRLTDTQRQQIQTKMRPEFSFVPDGYHQQYKDYSWAYKFAAANDGIYGAEAMAGLQASVDYLVDGGVIPCYNSLKPNGAEDGYYGKYYSEFLQFFDCLKHASNLDLIPTCVHIQNSWKFWSALYRPDYKVRRLTAKWNPTSVSAEIYFAWEGSRLQSTHAQALANMLVADQNYHHGETAMFLLAFYDPTLPASPLSAGELDWMDPYGWYLGRTGWNFGDSSRDVMTFFNMTPKMSANQGMLHYDISRGADDLISRQEYYEGDQDLHYYPWITQAQSFNTILIYDPSEDFGTFTHENAGQLPMPNAGQQGQSDREMAIDRWPRCTWVAGTGYDGEITVFDTTPERTLIEADATKAYSPEKASKVLRRWTWFRPDWVLVQDRVVLAKENLPVKSLIHCVNRPEIGITPTTVIGSWSTGGVFSAPIDQTIVMDHGNSSARVYVCAVHGMGSPTTELRIIGGANSSGQNWRQNQVSSDFGYVSSPSAISYEFYIEQTGKNYMPSDPGRVDGHDVEDRHIPPHSTGDWRVELTVSGARDTVDIAYLVHITDRNAPLATVTTEEMGSTLSILATAGEELVPILACPPGRQCASMDRP